MIGFGLHRDYELHEFRSDVVAAGLQIQLELDSWDVRPFTPESDFLVAVLSHEVGPINT